MSPAHRQKTWLGVPHDFLFQGPFGDQAIHIDHLLLTYAMSSVHGLEILHWVPVMLHKDNRVCARKCQPKPPNVSREEKTVDARVRVERLDNGMALFRICAPIQTHVRNGRHVLLEQHILNNIQHLFHLAED